MVKFGNDWDAILKREFEKEYYLKLRKFLKNEYESNRIYPNMHDIFNALKYTSMKDTKVVILGQDPYHGFGQAHGLSFSVKKGTRVPPSLQNIFKELNGDLKIEIPKHGELTSWAKQGVLLLNTVMTVREGEPNSHINKGWEIFTDEVIKIVSEKKTATVFILWGANAKKKAELISKNNNLVITGTHPSPLSAHRGFFGGKYFSRANEFLVSKNIEKINWDLA